MSDLLVIDIGINTYQEPVVYMRSDCSVCLAEGFSVNSSVAVNFNGRSIVATLQVVDASLLGIGEAGLSKISLERLGVSQGDKVTVTHVPVITSLKNVRKKVHGNKLDDAEIDSIIQDISQHRYRDIEIAAFLSVCAGNRLDIDEIIGLTNAMVACGKHLSWEGHEKILDKHCIGGLPGNRTTPLVVSIVSAAGFVIPKSSSRAITSPAGTADTMEALTRVNLDLMEIRHVVAETGACLVWGGAVNLSPADDLLIRIERALDLDGEGQLIASVLSKKIAAGSTHAVIDIPVGKTAKIRSEKDAERLASIFTHVGLACGIQVRCVITDGSQPVGRGIGPVEEARDVLSVLQGQCQGLEDLRDRSLFLAAHLLSLAGEENFDEAMHKARTILDEGLAWQQFKRIAEAQGGLKTLPEARYCHVEKAESTGRLVAIDNRQLARLAKLAGAPVDMAAGLRLHVRLGDIITPGTPLFTLMSDSMGERDYAMDYYHRFSSIFLLDEVTDDSSQAEDET